MADVVGRAGFHATHAKDPGERKPVVDEMMRSLDPERSAFWAGRNRSIVLADEHLNVELVNDGTGELVPCTDPQQVLDYGQSRLDRLHRKITPDHANKNGKMVGGTITTSMLVAHLPKSLCHEIPDYYLRFHKNGKPMIDPVTGEQMRRSRWVAKDRNQALQYFADVKAFFDESVVPGGAEACLGASHQFSESTPHGQWLYDTGADHPDKPGELRVETARAYFSHRDVRDDKGRVKSGKAKMRDYHAGLKEYLIAKGYDISPDFDEETHMDGFAKEVFEEIKDAKAEVEALSVRAQLDIANAAVLMANASGLATREAEVGRGREVLDELVAKYESNRANAANWLDDEKARLNEREADLDEIESSLDTMAASLENRRANLDDREQRIVTREQEVDERLQEAEQARHEARSRADALRAQVDRLEAVPADIDRWLDSKANKTGTTFRDIYARTAAQQRQRRAETLRIVDQHTSRETGLDDAQLG